MGTGRRGCCHSVILANFILIMRKCWLQLVVVTVLTACSTTPPAPVEDLNRSQVKSKPIPVSGYHTVVRGDTLYGIAFRYRLDYKAVAQWNSIRSPYTIYVGQKLRLTKPAARRSIAKQPPPKAAKKPVTVVAKPAPKPAPAAVKKPPSRKPETGSSAGLKWRWPTKGSISKRFSATDPAGSGIDLTGQVGQPILAAAAGNVVYSGNGLLGYGELVIIKHNDKLLSAYAHNSRRLVQEGDQVGLGQKIAEMGRNDANIAMLHFEVRLNGKPVNPLQYLPSR